MVPLTESRLRHRARVAYELGRLRPAARVLLVTVPLILLARLIGRPLELAAGLGGALSAVAFALTVLHDRYGRAILAGVLAGLPAFVLPLVLRGLGIVRLGAMGLDPCVPASFVSGVLAGALVSARAREEPRRVSFWLAAMLAAALTGTLGCSVAGSAGVLGLMAGVVAGTLPVVLTAGGTGLRRD